MDVLNRMKGGLSRPVWVSVLLVLTMMALFKSLEIKRESYSIFSIPLDLISGRVGLMSGRISSPPPTPPGGSCSDFFRAMPAGRKVVKSIRDFGGVGDGKTSNTQAFKRAIQFMERFKATGGSQLVVPKGRWLTGSFNLTSNFTLFLQHGAVILGSQDPKEWPIIEALPSYGRGRERLGARHISLIHGNGLANVVITGENGTVDGQGKMWWELWWNRTLVHTRGHLVELINSQNILIQDLTFLNSPFWTIHPVYCRSNVIPAETLLKEQLSW